MKNTCGVYSGKVCVAPVVRLAIIFTALSAQAAVRYVDIDAASGGDGLTWATAFREIQPAIDSAFDAGGGEVWVAEGVYNEQRDTFLGTLWLSEGIGLYGGFDGTEDSRDKADPIKNETTIDGSQSLLGSPVTCTIAMRDACVIKGFRLRGATECNLYAASNTLIENMKMSDTGICVYKVSNVNIRGCEFKYCSQTTQGGAIDINGNYNIEINECTFESNSSQLNGGAIFCAAGTSAIKNCKFMNNSAFSGGAIYLWSSDLRVENCYFENNTAERGGALLIAFRHATVSNCRFKNNRATEKWGGLGIELYIDETKQGPRIEKCLFEGNSAPYGGGLGYFTESNLWVDFAQRFELLPVVANCVFRENVATVEGHAIHAEKFAQCYFEYDDPEQKNSLAQRFGNSDRVQGAITNSDQDLDGRENADRIDIPGGECQPCMLYWPLMVSSCTFYANGTNSRLSTVYADSWCQLLYFYNCLFWKNSNTLFLGGQDTGDDMCLLTGRFTQAEILGCSLEVEPKFMDEANGDFHLQKESPCIDAGLDVSTVRYGSVVDDIDGQARGIDGDGRGPNGNGDVDIGAYEYRAISTHSADTVCDGIISLTELLRGIQLFNLRGYACAALEDATEDGYLPGTGLGHFCPPHASDYNPQDWTINLSELLRLIQLFNSRAYHYCPDAGTEDGYCPGMESKG